MPKLSDSMEEGTILKWCVKEGDKISIGAVILSLEGDSSAGHAVTIFTPARVGCGASVTERPTHSFVDASVRRSPASTRP